MNNQKIEITVPKAIRTFIIPAIKDGLPTLSGGTTVEFHNIRHDVRTIFSLKIDGAELNNLILTKKESLKKSDFMKIEERFGKRIAEEIQQWIPVFVA